MGEKNNKQIRSTILAACGLFTHENNLCINAETIHNHAETQSHRGWNSKHTSGRRSNMMSIFWTVIRIKMPGCSIIAK